MNTVKTIHSSIVLILPSAVAAQNVLSNSNFDTDLTDWTVGSSSNFAWSAAQDHHGAGSMGVGSALVVLPKGAVADPKPLRQCVAVKPTTSYGFGGWILATAPGCSPEYRIRVAWFRDSNCTMPSAFAVSYFTPLAPANNQWQLVRSAGSPPADVQSAAVQLIANCSAPLEDAVVYFDDIFLGDSMVPVTLQSFSIERPV